MNSSLFFDPSKPSIPIQKVELTDALTEDEFYLNGTRQDEAATAKITRFLDLFRAETGDSRRARVESLNFVPTAAGLASSASAFAALAGAMNEATGLQLPCSTTIDLRASW